MHTNNPFIADACAASGEVVSYEPRRSAPSLAELSEALLRWRGIDDHLKQARLIARKSPHSPTPQDLSVSALEEAKRQAKINLNNLIDRLQVTH